MKRSYIFPAGVLMLYFSFLFVFPANAGNNGKYKFRMNFHKGDEYKVSSMISMNVTQKLGFKDMVTKKDMRINFDLLISDIVDDSLGLVQVQYTKMEDFERNGDDSTTISSDDTVSGNMQDMMMHAITQSKIYMKISPTGRISDVTGIDDMFDNMINASGFKSDSLKQILRKVFNSIVNVDALKQQFSNTWSIFPGYPLSIGDEWTHTTNNSLLNSSVTSNYKVRDISTNYIVIDLSSDFEVKRDNDVSGNKMHSDIKGYQKGTTLLNPEDGLSGNTILNQTMDGTMTLYSNTGEDPYSWPLHSENKISFNITKVH